MSKKEFEKPFDIKEVKQLLAESDGIILTDDIADLPSK